ncbi:ethanolamine ammonia-lyase subunit EutC [Rhodovulum kholense]|uniref:Ethanolamine ammonia-lyase small subunit n=1 Tax=Rhodovulum kholense TaxID=453584 RepID=A0A8E2VI22_9RHOB|nr:ethanolamine ammonia-lyase subunit EutC [Rhodovulum kholense]PTW46629.1 ethanolamine ammonia-lyase light chain [Rhodovulum kholense]
MSGAVSAGFDRLRTLTPARVRLDAGAGPVPLGALLDFHEAHAAARDAIRARPDWDALAAALAPLATIRVQSRAVERSVYLRRPDLGRRLAEPVDLPHTGCPLVVVVGDGLSAPALAHAAPVIAALRAALPELDATPVILAEGARVALGDDIAERMGAAMCLMLIGERPGLSVSDSLGAYLTADPVPGTRDSARNCVSNIHRTGGLSPEAAAARIAWLIGAARRLGRTGVALKDESGTAPALGQA